MHALLDSLAARASVSLSADQHAAMERYLDLLLAANERMNLTRIVDREAMQLQHLADALTLLPYFPAMAFTLIDVGSGGGVPGIPLAIARPDASITLVESTKKKAAFLSDTVQSLGLTNVRVIDQRIESIGAFGAKSRETFDVAVARAVATMSWLVEWCIPLLKIGGKMLAMKGPKVHEELPRAVAAIKFLGGAEAIVHSVALPATDQRVIVEIKKLRKTPKMYPRDPTSTRGKEMP